MAQNYINKASIKKDGSTYTYIVEPTLYAAASTSNSGATYTASLDNFGLVTGATVQIKFSVTNAASATLNVNSTGAKNIYYNGAAITASVLKVNHTYTLTYDGTQWQLVGDIDTNTWRGIADNLTSSTATTTSLSGKQGYLLANGDARDNTKLPLDGGTMTGNILGNSSVALGTAANPFHNIVLGGTTGAVMTAASTNPRITFQENTGTQPVHLIYTDADAYRAPAGLKIIGGTSATPAWLEVEGDIYAASFKGIATHATAKHISTTSGANSINTSWIKVKITKKAAWMLTFTIRIYGYYDYYDYVISGYNYGTNKWYLPKVTLLGSTSTEGKTVKFGYDNDAVNNYCTLWVAIPASVYYGVDIFNVTNGYTQVMNDINSLFEIVVESTLTGTQQGDDVIAYRPWYRNEKVTSASSADTLATSRTIWGQSFDGSANISGNLTNAGPQLRLPTEQTTFQFLTSSGAAAYGRFGKLALYDNYSNGNLSNYYLDVGGATRIAGNLNMGDMGTPSSYPATGNKITWTGGTDGAQIYYSVTSADAGRLVFNTTDDTNCLIALAYNGTFKSYFNNSTPSFYPDTTNTGSLGLSGNVWASIYATNFYGSGTNITLSTASRAVVTDSNSKLSVSSVTSTELGYLSGVTSAIQTQLNGKSGTGHNHDTVYSYIHLTDYDFINTQPLSKYVTFDKSFTDGQGAPDASWYNGFVSSHSNYLGSYIINKHRTNLWYVGYSEYKTTNGTVTTATPTWYLLAHSGNVSTGDNNGQIKIAGVNVGVKGIAALAYKASLTASDIPNLSWNKITSDKPTTISGYGITDAVLFAKISAGISSGSGAAETKTYWADNTSIPKNSIKMIYNTQGTEYTLLFSNNNNNYGTVLKWGYADTYLRILRYHYSNGTQNDHWYSSDWEKISAGNADTATEFSSNASVALTGDVTGSASSKKGWSVATTIANKAVTPAKMADSATITIGTQAIKVGSSFTTSTLVQDLGLSKAMHFIGVATVTITDGSTTDPVISGYSTKTAGDVIIDKDSSREYVWSTTNKWELLGGDSSYWISSTGTTAQFWRGDNAWSDTINGGTLKITNQGNTLTIGSQNVSYCHFTSSANIAFYFNHDIQAVTGFGIYNGGAIKNQWRDGYLKISKEDGGDAYLELLRSSNADWRIRNSGGNLYFENNYTTSKTSYFSVLSLGYNTGNATLKGAITVGGGANITGALTLANNFCADKLRWGLDLFVRPFKNHATSPSTKEAADIYYDAGNADKYSNPTMKFRFNSWTANSTTALDTVEIYQFPTITADLAESKAYTILTSKNAVTISQGGTGATTPAGARNALFPLTTFTKSIILTKTWQNLGITGADLDTNGTYIIQLYLHSTGNGTLGSYYEYYSGVMSWYKTGTNSTDYDEIVLHKAGHASNGHNIFLRTTRVGSSTSPNTLQLQIKATMDTTVSAEIQVKCRLIID